VRNFVSLLLGIDEAVTKQGQTNKQTKVRETRVYIENFSVVPKPTLIDLNYVKMIHPAMLEPANETTQLC
jgi:hypothetical protein